LQHCAERTFDVDHPAAAGHFPGNPVIPGALLLDEILCAIAESRQLTTDSCQIRSAKFLSPVRPGDRVLVRWRAVGGGAVEFECLLSGTGRLAATGTLRLDLPTK